MSQKYNTFNLAQCNLGINSTGQNTNKLGLAKYIKNICIKNGKILSANSGENLFTLLDSTGQLSAGVSLLGGIVNMQVFEVYNNGTFCPYLVICSKDLQVYYCNLASSALSLVRLQDIQLTSKPIFETYISDNKNLLLISSATDEMWIWDGILAPLEVLNAPKVSSMAVGLERLFITCQDSPYKVYYSLDKDPSNWDNDISDQTNGEISFVDNLGCVIKVFALDNYIYVIRQNGIIKIYSTASKDSFKQSRLFVSTGKIYPNSVCLAGDKIVFLTSDGLYSFDGLNAKKIALHIDDLFSKDNQDCVAVCQDNIYWLCANVIDNYGAQKRAYLQIDLTECVVLSLQEVDCIGAFAIDYSVLRGVCLLVNSASDNNDSSAENSATQTLQSNTKTANSVLFLQKTASQTGGCGDFAYYSNNLPLEPTEAKKTISKLKILANTKLSLQINTNGCSKIFDILPSHQAQTFFVGISGDVFCVAISGSGKLELEELSIYYTYNT